MGKLALTEPIISAKIRIAGDRGSIAWIPQDRGGFVKARSFHARRAGAIAIVFGLYLSLAGYKSLEGDQAYRLPLLLRSQNRAIYRVDPFVNALQAFNPHAGYLAILNAGYRIVGLEATLFGVFAVAFALAAVGMAMLASAGRDDQQSASEIDPRHGDRSIENDRDDPAKTLGTTQALLAFILTLLAKAGDIGTNHLFEPILLDRLIAFAIGWIALGSIVKKITYHQYLTSVFVFIIYFVHPSLGLQIGLLVVATYACLFLVGDRCGVDRKASATGFVLTLLSLAPAFARLPHQSKIVFDGLSERELILIAGYIQSPQHMTPGLWRTPQVSAWFCYAILAVVAIAAGVPRRDRNESSSNRSRNSARFRLGLILAITWSGLAIAWRLVAIDQIPRFILFQPFRVATIARGLALVFIAEHVFCLWMRRTIFDRARGATIVIGLTGDWALVVATAFETTAILIERFPVRIGSEFASRMFEVLRSAPSLARRVGMKSGNAKPILTHSNRQNEGILEPMRTASSVIFHFSKIYEHLNVLVSSAVLIYGLTFLSRHDTQSGHWRLIAAIAGAIVVSMIQKFTSFKINRRRLMIFAAACWAFPIGAFLIEVAPIAREGLGKRIMGAVVERARFVEIPKNDSERLAVWCRSHTDPAALFVVPPGDKTFRLWSRRSVAFNRAASPYHAAGLADWFDRYKKHVGFHGSIDDFAHAYIKDRYALEHGYDRLGVDRLAELARDEGAMYVVAGSNLLKDGASADIPLDLVHREGRLAAYRVRDRQAIARARLPLNRDGERR